MLFTKLYKAAAQGQMYEAPSEERTNKKRSTRQACQPSHRARRPAIY